MTERDELAAEYVLGLLEGQDLLTARGLLASDPAFAASVADWEAKLAPLADAIVPVDPPARVWVAIESRLADESAAADRDTPQIVELRRRVRTWQIGTGIAAAIAAAAAAVVVMVPRPGPPVIVPVLAPQTPPLAAALAPKGGGSFTVLYHPDRRELVAVAPDLPAHAGRDLELWVLPTGSAPLPLGVMKAGDTRRIAISPAIAARIVPGATLAVSLEPLGGSPTGLPTGPVLATAKIFPS